MDTGALLINTRFLPTAVPKRAASVPLPLRSAAKSFVSFFSPDTCKKSSYILFVCLFVYAHKRKHQGIWWLSTLKEVNPSLLAPDSNPSHPHLPLGIW